MYKITDTSTNITKEYDFLEEFLEEIITEEEVKELYSDCYNQVELPIGTFPMGEVIFRMINEDEKEMIVSDFISEELAYIEDELEMEEEFEYRGYAIERTEN